MTKRLSIAGLIDTLEPGENVFIAGSAAEPVELTQALVDAPKSAPEVHFITSFVPGINARNLASAAGRRRMQVFFMQPQFRQARQQAWIEFMPTTYFGVHQHLQNPATALDSVIVQVGEPDASGQCSLGPSVEFMPTVLRRAKRVLGVINPGVPELPGAPRVGMDAFAAYARSTLPLPQYDPGPPNDSSARIAAHIAGLIPNGATLQIGLGKVPAQLLNALSQHRSLRFHSGMLSDSILGLVEAGALHAEQALTTTVVVGSERLYRRLPSVGSLTLAGVSYTHHPVVLGGLHRLHAINSAIEVDLLGQVNAELLDGRYLSGPGGLPDFAAAAHRQAEGLSVIALPASNSGGSQSRIVARLAAGSPISVPQHDVDAVVTEYGVARLRGATLDERMQRLIDVAHPNHREALRAAARELLATT